MSNVIPELPARLATCVNDQCSMYGVGIDCTSLIRSLVRRFPEKPDHTSCCDRCDMPLTTMRDVEAEAAQREARWAARRARQSQPPRGAT